MAKRLFVICGLGSRLSGNAANALNKKYSHFAHFLSFVSAPEAKYKSSLLRSILSNVQSHISSNEADLPQSITIIYAPDETQGELITACFLFAHLIPCNYRNIYDLGTVMKDICRIIDSYKFPSHKPYQYLPTRNFEIAYQGGVYNLFLNYFLNQISLDMVETHFLSKNFNCENFPNFLTGKARKKFYVDKRNLIFPQCRPNEAHGRYIGGDDALNYLSAYYRFGELKGCGFHYDVQYAKKDLSGTEFVCLPKWERITATHQTHANIYLNDAVRLG